MVDGSFSSLHSTARAWHIDAVRGRPPHQILSTILVDSRFGEGRPFDRGGVPVTYITVQWIVGTLVWFFIIGYFATLLIRDTIASEKGRRLGTVCVWLAVGAAGYIVWQDIIIPRFAIGL
jgi:hypothetical protein